MLSEAVKKKIIDIVSPDRYADQPEILACYAYDAFVEESLPDAVVFPESAEEISGILKTASEYQVPVTARGAGTSVCGAPIPLKKGIVLCFSKMDRILDINVRDRYVVVQPGVVNADVQKALAPFGFFYPPDPASMNSSTIGGNIAQNAGGPRCLKYGVTMDYILALEVVLASGKIVRFGSKNIKDVTGYKLTSLFCGSEGTLGIVTEATLKVHPLPETVETLLVMFDDLDKCAQAVSDIIGSGIIPAAMELLDNMTLNAIEESAHLGLDTRAQGYLLIEVDGIKEACDKQIRKIIEKVEANDAIDVQRAENEAQRQELWSARRSAYGVFARLAPDIMSEDVTVPVSRIPDMIRKIVAIGEEFGLRIGVLAHAGDGNMHPMIPGDKNNTEEWQRVEKAFDKIFHEAAKIGGTLSGEHGIGLAKSDYLPLVMNQDTIELMKTIKRAVDPENILNPGKFV